MIEEIRKKLIEGNLYKNPDLDAWLAAGKIGLDEEAVLNCVKEHSGMTFRGFVNELRIDMLIVSLNKEIIFEKPGHYYTHSGFKSRTLFEKHFKKRTGMTVQQYIYEFKTISQYAFKSYVGNNLTTYSLDLKKIFISTHLL